MGTVWQVFPAHSTSQRVSVELLACCLRAGETTGICPSLICLFMTITFEYLPVLYLCCEGFFCCPPELMVRAPSIAKHCRAHGINIRIPLSSLDIICGALSAHAT